MSLITLGYGSRLGGAARIAGFAALVVLLLPVLIIYKALRPRAPYIIPTFFHRCWLRLLGFRVRVHGAISTAKPTLFVCNHSSYLDIPVLGALIQGSFVAKAEVATWPFFGFLSKLQNTIFIERRTSRVMDQSKVLQEHLAARHNLILFPEGTSSDGQTVLPFKSSLFGIFDDALAALDVAVQPVSIICTELGGLPITRAGRPFYAWYGDMTLVGHLWDVLKLGGFTVDVVFHPPLRPRDFPNRKILAATCQQQVARGIDLCLTGRNLALGKMILELPAPRKHGHAEESSH